MVQAVWSTAHGHPLRVTNLAASRCCGSARTSTRCSSCSRRSGGCGRAPTAARRAGDRDRARRAARLPARAQAPRLAAARASASRSTYLLYPPTTWLALNEFHPGRARDARAAVRVLVPRRGPPRAVRRVRAARRDLPRGHAARDRRVRRLVRARARPAARGPGDRGRGRRWTLRRGHARDPALPRRRDAVRRALQRGARRGSAPSRATLFGLAFDHGGVRYLLDARPAARGALPARAGRARRAARARAEPPLGDAGADRRSTSTTRPRSSRRSSPRPCSAARASVRASARRSRRSRSRRALVGNYLLGAIPLWHELPRGESLQSRAAVVTEHDRVAGAGARADSAARSVVSATNSLGAHLSARSRVLSFPYVQDAKWIAVDETQPGYADRLAPLPTAAQVVVAADEPRVAARLRAGRRARLPPRPAALARAGSSGAAGTRR